MLDMQKRKTLCAAAVLMVLLTLFFTTLPLYAAGTGGMNSQGGTAGGVLENAADAVRGAAEDLFGGNTRSGGTPDGTMDGAADGIPENAAEDVPGSVPDSVPGSAPGDTAGNDGIPGNGGTAGNDSTTGNDSTLGDTDGDGVTDDNSTTVTDGAAEKTGSWGGILLAILAAVAVIVTAIILIPRKNTR